jgi:hypothetical protein
MQRTTIVLISFKKIGSFRAINVLVDYKHDEFKVKNYFAFFVKAIIAKTVNYLVKQSF